MAFISGCGLALNFSQEKVFPQSILHMIISTAVLSTDKKIFVAD
jgi:hypothetical protein